MIKRYLMVALIPSIVLTLSFPVFAQTKQKTQRTTPAMRPVDLGPPKVVSFKINNGAATTNSRTVILNNVTERATLFCASERPDLQGAYWKRMHSAPQFTLSRGDGKKTVYFQVADPQGRKSPIVSDAINISTTPTVTSFKVKSWVVSWDYNTDTTRLSVYTENVATNNPTQLRLSNKSDFSNANWISYGQRRQLRVGKGIGRRTVYLQVKNNYSKSKVYSATFDVPSRRDFTIDAGWAKSYSKPQGFNFPITPKDVTSRCEMSSDKKYLMLEIPRGLTVTGSKCDYSLFSGRSINVGWVFKRFSASSNCSPPDRDYSIIETPNSGSRQIRFKVHLWANPSKRCYWILDSIVLEGPGDADWHEAFR